MCVIWPTENQKMWPSGLKTHGAMCGKKVDSALSCVRQTSQANSMRPLIIVAYIYTVSMVQVLQ